MLLTIGMIVKNEEKYLDRCLSTIKPILDNVDSELIITDTGSTDRTVEIAEKYTDKVLHFDWINDFSAARNTGIENARGEWFMYLDADEIFQSCDGIIHFFNSGEYKKYNSASFIIRNLSADGSFNDFNARRLAKLTSDTRFSGVVHEHLKTLGEPCRQLDDIADHYGYIFENDADRLIKFERNYKLLLQKYETVKDSNPMIYAEMYDTLVTGFKQSEADEYLEKGIGWCIKHEHPILILLYCKKARHLLFEKQNDDALKVCDAYFGMSKNIRNETLISDAEILVIKATALYRQEHWAEASEALVVFFDVYDEIKSGKLNTKDKLYGSLSLASDIKYLSYIGQFLVCCVNTGKYVAAAEYMEKLPIYKYSDDRDTLNSVISLETILLENVGFEHLDKFCARLDEYGKKQLIEAAEKIRPKKSNNGKIILTIGMIVKNEEKYLDRCLSAIKPILDNVASELIITDTGSTDKTVEIAKKYTDKILHFEWINDFAAARNTAFEIAKGEWFMFLDADEIFRSCDNIIEFFRSGEYKKNNSATFVIKNYTRDNNIQTSFRAQRLTKIISNTKFEGDIHEHYTTYGSPIKHLSDVADHYGYMFENDEEAQKKSKRNIDLLSAKINNPNVDPMTYCQLYDSCITANNLIDADKYLKAGIDYCKKNKSLVLAVLYIKKAYQEVSNGKYEDAINTCIDYLNMDKSIRPGRLSSDREIYAILASSQLRTKRFMEAETSFAVFFDVFEMTENGTLDTPDVDAISFRASANYNYIPFVNAFLNCCIMNGHYQLAAEHLTRLPIFKYSEDNAGINETIDLEIKILQKTSFKYIESFNNNLNNYGKKTLAKKAEKFKSTPNSDNVVLTIGMIVKNEEKYLDRCLSAIKPILDNVNSELIITDTGSTDKTVEIAKKYTDKVLHFNWINDFAAARNTALDIANGEWFMFLDADEIFRSCDNIIDFFRSGEYKKYNSATFTIRNIYNVDNNSDYSVFSAPRLVRHTPETRFQNIVHETLNTFGEPIKHINDIADHYGYAYDSNISGKFGRNSALLLKRLENEPDSEMVYVQLYECYSSAFDRKTADEYLEKAEELCLKKKSIVLTEVYTLRAQMMFVDGQFEQCAEIGRKYFDMDKAIRPFVLTTDAEIRALNALSYYELGKYEEACREFCGLFDILPDVLSGRLSTNDAVLQNYEYAVERRFLQLLCDFLSCCLETKKYDIALKYLADLPFGKYLPDEAEIISLARKTAELAYKTEIGKVIPITEKFGYTGKRYFYFFIFTQIYSDNSGAHILSDLECSADEHIRKKASLCRSLLSDSVAGEEELSCFAENYGINADPDLLYIAMRSHADITMLLDAGTDIKQCVYMCAKYIDDFYNAAENYPAECITKTSSLTDAIKLYDYCISLRLMENADKPSEEKERIIAKLYRVKSNLNERYKRETSGQSDLSEFEQLALMLKTNVRNLASQGKYDDARKFLDEYAKIAPSDPEIPELYKLLN